MRTGQEGLLSIIIVNYNCGSLLQDCLQSLLRFKGTCQWECIIVDNSQNKEDQASTLSLFPFVRWIEMEYNAGFARANNVGIKAARGEAYLLLNPDTIILDQSICNCYARLMQSNYAAAGVQLLDNQSQPQISGSHFVKGGLNHLLPIPYWGALLKWAANKAGTKAPGVKDVTAVHEVDWISGAFLMVKRSAVEMVGMLDEDFFLYGEEVEWCSRLKKAGNLVLFGDLTIMHLEGATINKDQNLQEEGYYNLYDKKGLQLMVSNHLRVRKQYGVGWFFFLLINYSLGWLFYFIASTVHHLTTEGKPMKEWNRIGQFGKNLLQFYLLVPAIVSNKPMFYKLL